MDSKNSNNSKDNSQAESILTQQHILEEIDPGYTHQIKSSIDDNNTLDKLYNPYVENNQPELSEETKV